MFFGIGGVLSSSFGLIFTGGTLSLERYSQLGYIFLSSICGYIAQTTLVLGLRYEKAAMVSLIESLNVLYAFFVDIVVFGFETNIVSVGGSILAVGSCVYISFFNSKSK